MSNQKNAPFVRLRVKDPATGKVSKILAPPEYYERVKNDPNVEYESEFHPLGGEINRFQKETLPSGLEVPAGTSAKIAALMQKRGAVGRVDDGGVTLNGSPDGDEVDADKNDTDLTPGDDPGSDHA